MKLVFVSNYMTHHQKPLSDELFKLLGKEYSFIQTEEMSEERLEMGWSMDLSKCSFVLTYHDNPTHIQDLIDKAEVVMTGGASIDYIAHRLRYNKTVLYCDERPFKKGGFEYLNPRKIYMMLRCHTLYRYRNVSFLCAGAYVAHDLKLFMAYPKRKYAWGYFPEFIDYGSSLPKKEYNRPLNILWSGRMIDWKHPEIAVMVAEMLLANNIPFKMCMIGAGCMSNAINTMIEAKNLSDSISIISSVPYTQMHTHMASADIFLMTSDRQEGWGVVANEAMNNGAVLVANRKAGAIPFLVQNGVTGYSYCDTEELYSIMLNIVNNKQNLSTIRENAYQLIRTQWNPKTAARNLIGLLSGENAANYPLLSPCQKLD